MMNEIDWKSAVELAESYKAIGKTDLYLYRDKDVPWHLANYCEPGGSHRMDIATDVRFKAVHPCGLSFSWTFDIEERSANGKSYYEIRTSEISRVLSLLPADCANKFRAYLADCAQKVRARGDEYQQTAAKQYGEAAVLERLSKAAK